MRYATADLNLRAFGTLVARQMLVPVRFLDARRRAILLVHGYNVTEGEAVASMGAFRTTLAYYAPNLLPDTFICTWAGNWNIPGIRPLAYMAMLGHAQESSATFLEAIQQWYARPAAPEELVIVAHSLGCRLVLETLLRMQAAGRPAGMSKLIVVLMAAAVPTEHFNTGGRLRATLGAVDVMVVLHSQADTVLSRVFGLGQTLAGDGRFPEAVGLRAHPPGTPWTRSQAMSAFDHGDYWREMETAELVCQVLGFSIRGGTSGVPLAMRKRLSMHRLATMPMLPSN
jgi:Alpha/beta hydrolase of unknown function (DUF900)